MHETLKGIQTKDLVVVDELIDEHIKPALKYFGRMDRDADWENVILHSIAVGERASVLGKLLGLSKEWQEKVKIAGQLHDVAKKLEVFSINSNSIPEIALYDQVGAYEKRIFKRLLIEPEVCAITEGAGVMSFQMVDSLLKSKNDFDDFSQLEQAQIILHYIDDFTIGDKEVKPYDGDQNDVDRRSEAQEVKPGITFLDSEFSNSDILGGESLHQAQRRIAHQLEEIFTQKINQIDIIDSPIDNPKKLPQIISALG